MGWTNPVSKIHNKPEFSSGYVFVHHYQKLNGLLSCDLIMIFESLLSLKLITEIQRVVNSGVDLPIVFEKDTVSCKKQNRH
jgi:hypothetical protein